MDALADPLNAPSISEVAASISRQSLITFGNGEYSANVIGGTANYLVVNNLTEFAAGDGLYQPDIDTAARVAVIGSEVASELFADEFPVGKEIKIGDIGYEVVGVLEEQGDSGPFGNKEDRSGLLSASKEPWASW